MSIITNITLTANLNCSIKLKVLTNKTCNSVHESSHFQRVRIRLRKPKAAVSVFKSGKVVSVGSKSVSEGRVGIRRIARMSQKAGFKPRLSDIQVRNIASTHNFKTNINFEEFIPFLNNNNIDFKFCARKFPLLRISFEGTKVILAESGKIILTGVKSETQLENVFLSFNKLIENFKNDNPLQVSH